MKARVAINAQVNPATPGGVETNLLSLLEALRAFRGDGQIEVAVLALARYREAFVRRFGDMADVIDWPFGQNCEQFRPLPPRPAERGQTVRKAFGRHAHLFDRAVETYRRARYGQDSTGFPGKIDRSLRARGVRVVHFPTPQFFGTTLPFLYEPWDLQFLHYPEFFTPEEYAWRDTTYRAGCARARLVVTATRWVRDDIVRRFGIAPERVAAIPRASLLASVDLSAARREALEQELRLPANFVFYPAMCFEHKNHLRLFQALALLRERDGLRIDLVMSGRQHRPFWPTVERELERLRLGEQVRVLGAVSDEVLTFLYSKARFMAFPSLFEGLGLPLLEAMRHGLPIVAARETCIPEVVGKAAILFDGKDVEDMASAIRRGWMEPDRARATLAFAPAQLQRFDWQDAAATFAACYRSAAGSALSEEERARVSAATAP
jgi:glycosyltransferase involved in cell wall biosynthesis